MQHTLNREQFIILEELADSAADFTKINGRNSQSNTVIHNLCLEGYIENGHITQKGLAALEPYKVKRAVFIAAGFGSRLVPITINTPKPLIRVNGKRIIDGLIDACISAGINEIYVVRGYLAEQFDQLLYKYPMIRFIENPFYEEANNISSAMLAGKVLENAYVFEADLQLKNPFIIKKYQYTSNYLGIKKAYTDDWCFKMNDDGTIGGIGIGGTDCYQVVGISYWDSDSGKRLADDLTAAYAMPNGKNLYWDQVALEVFQGKYVIEVRECMEKDIVEIDTFDELKTIDSVYNTEKDK